MRAFLSHSSKDKYFVRKVAEELGKTQIEFDESTFELTLNNKAIRSALQRSNLFVLFVSKNSVSSTFVSEEERGALELRARGIIRECLIFAIDDTSYKALPEWLRDINMVNCVSSPKACARKIQSILTSIDLSDNDANQLYLGREEDEKKIRKALSAPPRKTPLFLHAVGHPGIGRKSFLRKSLQNTYPRLFQVFVEITMNQYGGIDDLYRSLYSLNYAKSLEETIDDLDRFHAMPPGEQMGEISGIIREMSDQGEFILLNDEGSVYDDNGDYQQIFSDLLNSLSPLTQPVLGFIQTRMMPTSRRQNRERSYHTYLSPLSDDTVKELLSFELKSRDIDFDAAQLDAISDWLDGHPYNVKFAVKYIENYGIRSIVADPSELIEWKRHRAEDFLVRINFTPQQTDIIAALSEYRFIAAEMMFSLFDVEQSEIARDLRRLEEFCCIERRHDFFHISAPLREAVRRDERFLRPDKWKQSIGSAICDAIGDYKNEDSVSLEILESATIAAAKGAKAPAFLANLILPSHLLRIARDFYDRRQWKISAEFCGRAWDARDRLPTDANVELLRIWGLSSIRTDDTAKTDMVLTDLAKYDSRMARRVGFFLRGFRARVAGDMDDAESKFLEAFRISPDNESVNRELASLYCKQKRFPEAERHARAAYERYPTNPFLIDVYAESLLGKMHQGLPVDKNEMDKVFADLRRYGDAPGSSFFLIRDAQQKAKAKDFPGALRAIDSAISRTPSLLPPYFIRADIRLSVKDVLGAESDLNEINAILNRAGGYSREDEAQSQELEIRILVEKYQFQNAKDKIERSAFIPGRVKKRLLGQLARSIGFEPNAASVELQAWAKKYSS